MPVFIPIDRGADSKKLKVVRLFDALAIVDEEGILNKARAAAGGA